MKIASFNINGIKARLPALLDWLAEAAPDVVCLQEIKSIDENFPREPIEDLGYNIETHGQKSFNGVAILSKFPIEDVVRGLPGDPEDEQARWIEATINTVRICGLYLPNGNPVDSPKFPYKLRWMARMKARAAELLASEEIALMCGDFNIIPQPEDAAPMNYTFWDFQAGAWNKNDGIRIDHFLLSPQAADRLRDCKIDRHMRGRDKPSDHVPIWVELEA